MKYFILLANENDKAVYSYVAKIISEAGGSVSWVEFIQKMHARFKCLPGDVVDEKNDRVMRVYRDAGKKIYSIENGMVHDNEV